MTEALPAEFVGRLRCPLTGQKLRAVADAASGLDGRVFADGAEPAGMEARQTGLLAAADDRTRYLVVDGILCLLPSMALIRPDDAALRTELDSVTRSVQAFYDEVGWAADPSGAFEDGLRFEDRRPVAGEYIDRCHRRVARHFEPEGHYLLDVASGPVQHDAYLAYHQGYRHRVCVDISFAALKAAHSRLGDEGIYVMGDITRLPFAADCFDGVVSLHTIYHVPFASQRSAFEELYRVLAPGRRAAVVYSWGRHARIPRVLRLPYNLASWPPRLARHPAGRYGMNQRAEDLELHFDPAPPAWFTGQAWPFSYRIACWRFLDVGTMKALAQPWLFGAKLLRLLYRAEERWPRRLGLLGQYPIIEISKPETPKPV